MKYSIIYKDSLSWCFQIMKNHGEKNTPAESESWWHTASTVHIQKHWTPHHSFFLVRVWTKHRMTEIPIHPFSLAVLDHAHVLWLFL